MTSLHPLLLFLWAILTGCLAILQVQPVTDDLEDKNDYYRTNYYSPSYITAKRSFIYPQYDVERFALVPETTRDEKRDFIKGPSIDPVIEDDERVDIVNGGVQDNGAFQAPQVEVEEENPRKFSDIAREGEQYEKTKHKKISQKEKEALSAGLIKLLYDWKLHRKHASSGSGSKEGLKAMHTNGEPLDGNSPDNGEGMHASIRSSKERGNYQGTQSQIKSTSVDTEQDPLSESKSGQNLIAAGKAERQNKEPQVETSQEEDEGSAEFTKRKSKGKINVLVNVNINERSIRSKVSHASKTKQTKTSSKNAIKYENKSAESEEEETENVSGEGDDDEDDGNEDGKVEMDRSNDNLPTDNSSSAIQKYQNNPISQVATSNINTNTSTSIQPQQQSRYTATGYRAMEEDQNSPNLFRTTASASNARKMSGTSLISRETEDEASGDEEYDSLEEKIKEEGASGFSGSTESKETNEQQKPKKSLTTENKPSREYSDQSTTENTQNNIQETNQLMTKGRENKKTHNKNKKSKHHVKETTMVPVKNDETYESDKQEENELSAISSKKPNQNHKEKRKSNKLKPIENSKSADETFRLEGNSGEKSTAAPKYSKPRDNPKIVTKSSDNVGKVQRPEEATNQNPKNKESTKITENYATNTDGVKIETQKLEKYGTKNKLSPGKHPDSTEISSDNKEEIHLVKLHDSEIQLLKEHRAKLQSSEPIVIDDIKKKQEKPKQNPKEATKFTEKDKKIGGNGKPSAKMSEDGTYAKPTTKRNFVTAQKPEEVLPLTEEHNEKDNSNKQIVKESAHLSGHAEKSKEHETGGSGDDEPKKYGSLKSVRERFKAWEKEMISRLSNPFLNNNIRDDGSGDEKLQDKSYKSWTEEEKDLISKLSNPFLHQKTKTKAKVSSDTKGEKTEDKKMASKESDKDNKNADKPKHDATKDGDTVKDNLSSSIKDEKSTATPDDKKLAEIAIKNQSELKSQKIEKVTPTKNLMQSFVPGEDEKEEKIKKLLAEKEVDMQQLEKFRQQIITEVGKIDKLEEEYKKNMLKSNELKAAKETLTKDLTYIKDIEKKLAGNLGKSNNEKDKEGVKEVLPKEKPSKVENTKGKEDPLMKIQGLLQAEMMRSKDKKKNHADKQLENIRGLLKQELKKLIKSGKLGTLDNLPSGLRKLGKMIHQKLKAAKKKKNGKKKPKKNKKKQKKQHGKDLKNSLDLVKEYKPTEAGSNRGHITTMSKYKAAMDALKTLKGQQEISPLQPNVSSSVNSTQPTKPHVVMPHNLPTGAQAQQFKDLLKNLNKKIGEVYSKLQSTTQRQQPNTLGNNQQTAPNTAMNPGNSFNPQPTNTAFIPMQQSQEHNAMPQSVSPITSSFSNPEIKHNLPVEPEEPKDEPEPDTVLAEAEPVETLIENLEKDITDVWSFREQYPDAVSLGLDNDKIHKAYANLGSLSGLNLRRSLERALRGRDVGLVIVGGSISKGGPFSEKGVDYALKTYFYAIADWWNKVIRPVTGSGMVIRDVSIGGIATDYYSYCLRSHVPNDKLNNIVLWELSANDMHRYDDGLRPKQQLLEQFTQEVLSLKSKPALIYLNFFALFSWDQDLLTHCRNFEDEGEDEVSKHYKITSLSWRDMVCSLMQENKPLFTRDELFAEDQFHPSIEAHAQMAYVIIDYIRTEFLKNLVKQRFLEIGDAARKLKIPETVYVPKPMYKQTFTWKPLCYTYMIVDNKEPNNTLTVKEEVNGDFHYTVLREFKIRSDKIVGMETKKGDQFITYDISVPLHRNGDATPYKSLVIMSFTDNREAEVRFDSSPVQKIETAKKFLEGTVLKYIATNVTPGSHKLTIRSGPNGFIISAIMLG